MNDLEKYEDKPIVFFDGVCNLCNWSVDWIWKRNLSKNIFFSSLQSDFAREFLKGKLKDDCQMETVLFFDKGKLYSHSAAIFRIMQYLKGVYPTIGAILSCIPQSISDFVYKRIAGSRYHIFGKKDHCRIPRPEEKARFLQ